MTETRFDAKDAANLLREMGGYEGSLRRRTEGITWMIWALVFAGLTMSFYAGELARPRLAPSDAPRPWTLLFPWSPWVLVGGLATVALWRSTALHAPDLARPWWKTLLGIALVPVAMWALFILSWILPAAIQALVTPPTLLGLASLVVLLTPLLGLTPQGRRVGIAAAATQTLAGIALGAAAPSLDVLYLVSTVVLGGTWLAAGLWQTTRG